MMEPKGYSFNSVEQLSLDKLHYYIKQAAPDYPFYEDLKYVHDVLYQPMIIE